MCNQFTHNITVLEDSFGPIYNTPRARWYLSLSLLYISASGRSFAAQNAISQSIVARPPWARAVNPLLYNDLELVIADLLYIYIREWESSLYTARGIDVVNSSLATYINVWKTSRIGTTLFAYNIARYVFTMRLRLAGSNWLMPQIWFIILCI